MAWCTLCGMQKFVSLQDTQTPSAQAHSCSVPRQQCQHLCFHLSGLNLSWWYLSNLVGSYHFGGTAFCSMLISEVPASSTRLVCSLSTILHNYAREELYSSQVKAPIPTSTKPNVVYLMDGTKNQSWLLSSWLLAQGRRLDTSCTPKPKVSSALLQTKRT